MGRTRPSLGTPFGTDGPWLAALLDVMHDVYDLIDARLPQPAETGGEGGRPVRVTEPAPDRPPVPARPVTEPAPDNTPDGEDDDVVPVTEPAPDETSSSEADEPGPEPSPGLPEPPRKGKGASQHAWLAFARANRVDVPDTTTRADIIAACVAAGVIATD